MQDDADEGRKVALTDDPWTYDTGGRNGCIEEKDGGRIYETMTPEALRGLEIPATRVVFMWATMPMWPVCLDVMRGRGFVYRGIHLVWVKRHSNGNDFNGMGGLTASNIEVMLLGVRPGFENDYKPAQKYVTEVALKGHSIKPQVGYDEVLAFCKHHDLGRPLEMFARCTERPGFDFGLGDQVEMYRGMSAAEVARVSGERRRAEKKARALVLAGEPVAKRTRGGLRAPKRPKEETLEIARTKAQTKTEAAASYFPLPVDTPVIVLNQQEEYAVVVVRETSGTNLMRLDMGRGLHKHGLLVVEASAQTLNETIHAVDALQGFRYVTVLWFVYCIENPTLFSFFVVAARTTARVQFWRRKAHKQTIPIASETEWPERMERVMTAISSMTGGARAAVLEFGFGDAKTKIKYVVTEFGGSLSDDRNDDPEGSKTKKIERPDDRLEE